MSTNPTADMEAGPSTATTIQGDGTSSTGEALLKAPQVGLLHCVHAHGRNGSTDSELTPMCLRITSWTSMLIRLFSRPGVTPLPSPLSWMDRIIFGIADIQPSESRRDGLVDPLSCIFLHPTYIVFRARLNDTRLHAATSRPIETGRMGRCRLRFRRLVDGSCAPVS